MSKGLAAVSAKLVAQDPVKAALGLTTKMSEQEIATRTSARERAKADVARLEQMLKGLLPVERRMRPMIEAKKVELNKLITRLGSPDRLKQYPSFSLEPLTWRDEHGYPRLAVFSLNSPDFELRVVGERHSSVNFTTKLVWRPSHHKPRLPKAMADCYTDVLTRLKTMAKKSEKAIRLRAEFAALIPPEVKDKIQQAKKHFRDEIFIVAEVRDWSLTKTAVPRPSDPLVVGFDGTNCWLIAAFDTTPLEELIAAIARAEHNKQKK
ncbi:MAG: hypothetical protein WCV84_02790 [Patescibacteria group bacterium]